MAWKTSYNSGLGVPTVQINTGQVDTVKQYPLGTRVKMFDDAFGDGEFIYLPGTSTTARGQTVVYDLNPAAVTTERTSSTTHLNSGRPVAVAMGPTIAATFGWFQISGVAIVQASAGIIALQKVFLTTGGGFIDDAPVAGCQVIGAVTSSAFNTPIAGYCYVTINNPSIQTQIT